MGRVFGNAIFSSNFEPRIASPLDARMLVNEYSDLMNINTWNSGDGNSYVYAGMLVVVVNDADVNKNGLYLLLNSNYTIPSNWMKLGSGENIIGAVDNIYDLININANEGQLYWVKNVNTIYRYYTNYSDLYFQSDGLLVIESINPNGLWIGVSGKYSYYHNNIKRVDLMEFRFRKSHEYPINLLGSILYGKYPEIFYDNSTYIEYGKFLFWEFIIEDDITKNIIKKFENLRFFTITDIENFINNNVISNDGGRISNSLQINVYLRQITIKESLNNLVSYNSFISELKGRHNLQSSVIKYLDGSIRNPYNIVNFIYTRHFNEIPPANASKTISFPINYKNFYNLLPIKYALGKLLKFNNSVTDRYIYDTVNKNVISLISLGISNWYLYTSFVISINKNRNGLLYYNNNEFKYSDYVYANSSIRIYDYVDDLNNPRYHFLIVKAIGVDRIIIPYITEINSNNPLKCGYIFNNNMKVLKIGANISNNESSIEYNSNRSFRINVIDIIRKIFRTNKLNKRHNGVLRFFVYDDLSGLCSQFSETFMVKINVSGAPIIVLSNRLIRNDK